MKIHLSWEWEQLDLLHSLIKKTITDLQIEDSLTLHITNDSNFLAELGITSFPSLSIEEESIWFKDMIFQGQVPELKEIKELFSSMVGDETWLGTSWCSTGGCSTCESGC